MSKLKLTGMKEIITVCLFLVFAHQSNSQPLPPIKEDVTRTWIGPEYWTNPLMNWRLSDGRMENTHSGWNNEVHSLTHQLKKGEGRFRMSVRMGLLDHSSEVHQHTGFAGFKIGARGHRNDYRSNILHDLQNGFSRELKKEPPLSAGITSDGYLLIGSDSSDHRLNKEQMKDLVLQLTAYHTGEEIRARLLASHANKEIAVLETTLPRVNLFGNIALACHGFPAPPNKNRYKGVIDHSRFWFSEWNVSGDKFQSDPAQTYGPVLWSQYTLHHHILKLMVFLVPMEEEASKVAEFQIREENGWKTIAESEIDCLSQTALFRVEGWDEKKDLEYRVIYKWDEAKGKSVASWGGTIRKDPLDKDTIVLAGLSCSNSDLFPFRFLTENLLAQDPDLVFFSGDQIYEANGGYWIILPETEAELPRAALNYLGKFWLSIIGFRDLLKDRPTVMVPDDHDLYSNDLWGKGGIPMGRDRCFGGYKGHPDWINMVEYTQMGNRPDAYDPTPLEQGIRSYTTSLDVGGVSFALINDRKFKSAPGDVIDSYEPLFAKRGKRNIQTMDNINEEDFDTRILDREDLVLLGKRQLEFLHHWSSNDASLRAVLSQSAFCQPHHLMFADMDSNGWPQSGRRRALEVIREARAVMVTGDLHFASLVQQGIDDWEDAGWSFTLPSVSTNTHRFWRPRVEGQNRLPGMPDYTGRYLDGWGNKMTIWAAVNPGSATIEDPFVGDGKRTLEYIRHTTQGYGIVRFIKSESSVTFESWPVYGNFDGPEGREQYPGFPRTIKIR
jgi:hypothetical protein